jgi:hypothetical protein
MTWASGTPAERARAIEVKRRLYAKEAPTYEREADFIERRLFGTEHRGWAYSKATGDTLEVAADDPAIEQPEAFLRALRAALGRLSRPLEERSGHSELSHQGPTLWP